MTKALNNLMNEKGLQIKNMTIKYCKTDSSGGLLLSHLLRKEKKHC